MYFNIPYLAHPATAEGSPSPSRTGTSTPPCHQSFLVGTPPNATNTALRSGGDEEEDRATGPPQEGQGNLNRKGRSNVGPLENEGPTGIVAPVAPPPTNIVVDTNATAGSSAKSLTRFSSLRSSPDGKYRLTTVSTAPPSSSAEEWEQEGGGREGGRQGGRRQRSASSRPSTVRKEEIQKAKDFLVSRTAPSYVIEAIDSDSYTTVRRALERAARELRAAQRIVVDAHERRSNPTSVSLSPPYQELLSQWVDAEGNHLLVRAVIGGQPPQHHRHGTTKTNTVNMNSNDRETKSGASGGRAGHPRSACPPCDLIIVADVSTSSPPSTPFPYYYYHPTNVRNNNNYNNNNRAIEPIAKSSGKKKGFLTAIAYDDYDEEDYCEGEECYDDEKGVHDEDEDVRQRMEGETAGEEKKEEEENKAIISTEAASSDRPPLIDIIDDDGNFLLDLSSAAFVGSYGSSPLATKTTTTRVFSDSSTHSISSSSTKESPEREGDAGQELAPANPSQRRARSSSTHQPHRQPHTSATFSSSIHSMNQTAAIAAAFAPLAAMAGIATAAISTAIASAVAQAVVNNVFTSARRRALVGLLDGGCSPFCITNLSTNSSLLMEVMRLGPRREEEALYIMFRMACIRRQGSDNDEKKRRRRNSRATEITFCREMPSLRRHHYHHHQSTCTRATVRVREGDLTWANYNAVTALHIASDRGMAEAVKVLVGSLDIDNDVPLPHYKRCSDSHQLLLNQTVSVPEGNSLDKDGTITQKKKSDSLVAKGLPLPDAGSEEGAAAVTSSKHETTIPIEDDTRSSNNIVECAAAAAANTTSLTLHDPLSNEQNANAQKTQRQNPPSRALSGESPHPTTRPLPTRLFPLTPSILTAAELLKTNPNVRTYHGSSALYAAVKNGHTLAVKALLEAGADPDGRDYGGGGPIDSPSAGMDMGIGVGVADLDGRYPLHHAVVSGHAHMVELLVSYGASLDAMTTRGGYGALQYAIDARRSWMVKLLLDLGANPNGAVPPQPSTTTSQPRGGGGGEKEGEGFNVRVCCNPHHRGRYCPCQLLNPPPPPTPLYCAAERGMANVCKMLLDCGAVVEGGPFSSTPLPQAVGYHQPIPPPSENKEPNEAKKYSNDNIAAHCKVSNALLTTTVFPSALVVSTTTAAECTPPSLATAAASVATSPSHHSSPFPPTLPATAAQCSVSCFIAACLASPATSRCPMAVSAFNGNADVLQLLFSEIASSSQSFHWARGADFPSLSSHSINIQILIGGGGGAVTPAACSSLFSSFSPPLQSCESSPLVFHTLPPPPPPPSATSTSTSLATLLLSSINSVSNPNSHSALSRYSSTPVDSNKQSPTLMETPATPELTNPNRSISISLSSRNRPPPSTITAQSGGGGGATAGRSALALPSALTFYRAVALWCACLGGQTCLVEQLLGCGEAAVSHSVLVAELALLGSRLGTICTCPLYLPAEDTGEGKGQQAYQNRKSNPLEKDHVTPPPSSSCYSSVKNTASTGLSDACCCCCLVSCPRVRVRGAFYTRVVPRGTTLSTLIRTLLNHGADLSGMVSMVLSEKNAQVLNESATANMMNWEQASTPKHCNSVSAATRLRTLNAFLDRLLPPVAAELRNEGILSLVL